MGNFSPTEESQTGLISLAEMFISFSLPQEMNDRVKSELVVPVKKGAQGTK